MRRRTFLHQLSSLLNFAGVGILLSACGYEETEESLRSAKEGLTPPSSGDAKKEEKEETPKPLKLPNKTEPTDLESPDKEDEAEEKPDSLDDTEYQSYEFFPLYAYATYFDGSTGPITGEIDADMVSSEDEEVLAFWHGHGGRQHYFTLKREHKIKLIMGERVEIETTEVDRHQHILFIDPQDIRTRIPGVDASQIRLKVEKTND